MKILLIEPYISPKINSGVKIFSPNFLPMYPPLGLLYIGSALESQGHEVELLDLRFEGNKDNLKNLVQSADAVGISVLTDYCNSAKNIAELVKEKDPDIPVIIGGPHCIFSQKSSLLDIPHADIGVIGEGELTVLDIAKFLEGNKKLADINGICYKEDNAIKFSKPSEAIKDLDSINFPARHLVDKYDYGATSKLFPFKRNFTSMITTRGCPFKCRFCAHYGNVIEGWSYRARSAENVIEEMKVVSEKYNSVIIVDDNFLADKKRSLKIMDSLIEMGTEIDLIIGGARVDSADKELYQKMKKANVKFMEFGIESGNQDVLDFYNKHITLDKIRSSVNLANKMGFITMGSFIFGSPIENIKHIRETVKFACSLPLDIAHFRPLFYQRGSQLWFEAVKTGKIQESESLVGTDSRRGLGNFTLEELLEFTKGAYKQFYLRPSYLFSQIYKAFKRRDFNLLKTGMQSISSLY